MTDDILFFSKLLSVRVNKKKKKNLPLDFTGFDE